MVKQLEELTTNIRQLLVRGGPNKRQLLGTNPSMKALCKKSARMLHHLIDGLTYSIQTC